MKTLIDLFKLFEERRTDAFVYRTGIRRFTFKYSEIYNLSLQMAQYLSKQGISSGDKVALWAPNSPSWAFSYFGILLIGAIVVPIDFAGGKKRAETIIRLSQVKFIIQSIYKFDKLNLRQLAERGVKTVLIEDLDFIIKSLDPINKITQPKSEDIAEIVYTSGTTGEPKGVVLTHKNIISNILQGCRHISITMRCNFLSVLPLSHMLEQTVGFLMPLYRGDKIIYIRTVKPSSIMQAFKEENIVAMLVVPRFLSLLKNTIERELTAKHLIGLLHFQITKKIISKYIHKKFGKSFQMFITGGAALALDIFRFWEDLGFRVIEGYGLTECAPIVSANTFEKQIPGSVGKPLVGVKVKLDNNELLVKGGNVFSKYHQNLEATDRAFKNGWFRTGDYVDIDDKKNIFIKGRKKDVIVNTSGVNIYPDEIESILNKTQGVKESCVVGLNKGEGEEVHAILILKNKSVKPHEVIREANDRLDPLQQIVSFSIWEDFDFPRTTTLKVQKFKVKETILNQNKKDQSDLTTDTLISLLSNVTRRKLEIKENSILALDLGLNSLSRLELINYLEQEYRVDLEDTIINQDTTVADLRKLLEKREKGKLQRGLWFWINNRFGRTMREFLDIIFHKPVSHLFFELQNQGLSNLKNIKGSVIFISNHVSYLDQPAIMYSLPRNIRYKTASAIREEYFFSAKGTSMLRKLLFPYAIIGLNAFLLPQKSGFRKSLSFMGKLVDNGVNILVFPEGERTRTGKLGTFMSGLGLMVKELQVPVVPIRMIGMEKIYPRGSKFPKKGKCTIIFGKPLEFTTETPTEIIEISHKAVLDLAAKFE